MKTTIAILAGVALLAGALHAQVPQLINYQGRVAVSGTNFDGTGQFKFALVNGDGSVSYWSNDGTSSGGSQPVAAVSLPVSKGLYSVLLGDATLPNMTVVPATVFTHPDVRLRVWFNDGSHGWQLLSPDQRIAAVGYAMIASSVVAGSIGEASLADGAVTSAKLGSGTVTTDKIANGSITEAKLAFTVGGGGSGVPNGMQEFTETGEFEVPAGVTRIMVELWGGGGGARPADEDYSYGGNGGFSMHVLEVTPGQNYAVEIGAGGAPGVSGEQTRFLGPEGPIGGGREVLLWAGGGSPPAGVGDAGAGGLGDPAAMISRQGYSGWHEGGQDVWVGSVSPPFFTVLANHPYFGVVKFFRSSGGGYYWDVGWSVTSGAPGYALIQW